MSTAEVVALMKAGFHELEERFNLVPEQDLSLLQDEDTKEHFYSVCGYPTQCSCRYTIISKTRHAKQDMLKRPAMDERALYLHGLDPRLGDDAKVQLQETLVAAGCNAKEIKVVRTYAFLTFDTHALAAAAQTVLTTQGYSIIFNRRKNK